MVKSVKKEKLVLLDFARVMSAFFIFLFHSNMHLGCDYKFLTPFLSQGAIFMISFFMLSGFILYYNYHEIDLLKLKEMKSFYYKRILSIYPLYIFVSALSLIFIVSLSLKEFLIILPIELLLLQSFFSGFSNVFINGGTWFISCIFFCYLCFPFIKNTVKQIEKVKILYFFVIYFICSFSTIMVQVLNLNNIYSNPFFRLLEFLLGILIASRFLNSKKTDTIKLMCLIILEIFILIVGVTALQRYKIGNYLNYGFFVIPIFSLLIFQMAKINSGVIKNFFGKKIFQYLSKISYAFFLAQFFTWKLTLYIKTEFEWFNTHTNSKLIFISFAICLIISILLYEIIEKPFIKIVSCIKEKSICNTEN